MTPALLVVLVTNIRYDYLVQKLQKQFLVIDPETGEKKVEVPAEGFPLSPTRLEMRRSALQT